jgi:hypothetical protein
MRCGLALILAVAAAGCASNALEQAHREVAQIGEDCTRRFKSDVSRFECLIGPSSETLAKAGYRDSIFGI